MFFFFNDTATTEIYTLSLHDALPIFLSRRRRLHRRHRRTHLGLRYCGLSDGGILGCHAAPEKWSWLVVLGDRKSTRLNSSHANISYAVFCLKKKKNTFPY